MDVTFFESQSYLSCSMSQTSLQGEPWYEEIHVPLPPVVEQIEDVELAIVVEKEEDKIYVKDKDRQKVTSMQKTTFPPLLPTSSPDECPESSPSPESPGNSDHNAPIPKFSDLDVPIANKRRVRSCTQHPITNHVSYSNLSSTNKVFLSKVSSMSLPTHFQDALSIPEWKYGMMEEMRALSKSST